MSRLELIAAERKTFVAGRQATFSRVAAIRKEAMANLPELVPATKAALEQKLAKVYLAKDAAEARQIIAALLAGGRQVARAYSNTLAEIDFDGAMAELGIAVRPTRLEEIIQQEQGLERNGHPHLATIDQSRQTLEEGLRKYAGCQGAVSEVKEAAKAKIKEDILHSDFGVTGANCVVAENGVLVMIEDEGNVRAVSNLPFRHLAVVGIDKIVPAAEDAMAVVQATTMYGTGKVTPTYMSLVAGPSRTADIEFKMAYGMHGPKELHIVLLDNGRSALVEQGAGVLLECINCGACYEACAALAKRQNWEHSVCSPKGLALDLVQGKCKAQAGELTLADYECPIGLSPQKASVALRNIIPL